MGMRDSWAKLRFNKMTSHHSIFLLFAWGSLAPNKLRQFLFFTGSCLHISTLPPKFRIGKAPAHLNVLHNDYESTVLYKGGCGFCGNRELCESKAQMCDFVFRSQECTVCGKMLLLRSHFGLHFTVLAVNKNNLMKIFHGECSPQTSFLYSFVIPEI